MRRRVADQKLLKLIRMWLKAPIVETRRKAGGGRGAQGGPKTRVFRSERGTPQGVISPRLANAYLHWLDYRFHRPGGPGRWAKARLVRYADDFVVLARYIDRRITGWIESVVEGWMELTINREKTRIVQLRETGASLDFLGFTFRYDRDLHGGRHRYLNVTVSKKSLVRERAALNQMMGPQMCFKPLPELIGDLNTHLRGWANYYAYGHPRKAFRQVNTYVRYRLSQHMRRRSQRPWRSPKGVTNYQHFHRMGLVYL